MKNEFDYLNDVKMDFSCYEELDEKETKTMKIRKIARSEKILIAACVTVLTVTTAFASGFVSNIIKVVSTGYNSVYQYDSSVPQPLPEYLKGKLFDKDGNAIDAMGKGDLENIYDENGNRMTKEKFAEIFAEATGGLVMVDSSYNSEVSERNFATIEEAQNAAVFDIKTPSYLPDGYTLDRLYAFKDENGNVGGEYMNIVYKNTEGREIIIFERLLNENTAFDAGTDGSVEELMVNGRKAALTNNSNLYFETEDNVSVGIAGKGNITRDELIKMAESIN